MTIPPPNNNRGGRDKELRSPKHRAWIRTRLCIAWQFGTCFGKIEAAHCRDVAPRGHGGGKPSDIFTAPFCRKHHTQAEKRERAWGEENGIDVLAMCLELAEASPDRAIREAAKAYAKPTLVSL